VGERGSTTGRFHGRPRRPLELVRAYPRRLLAALGALLLIILGSTWRIRRSYRPGCLAVPQGPPEPTLVVLFHATLLLGVLDGRDAGIAILASRHGDGSLVGEIASWLGMRVISGSSSRDAMSAFRGIERSLEEGISVAVTADGPRGPRTVLKPGMLGIASRTGAAVNPVCYAASHSWRFPSWDGLRTRQLEAQLGLTEDSRTRPLEPGEDPRPRPRRIRWISPARR
jgi:lysophospholipid acyltransferase (LPLAT)-like uncharacterized protein